MSAKSPNTSRSFSRNIAACLMALLTATVMIPGISVYLPLGIADRIGIPIFLFPFIWTGLFLYSYLAKNAWHPWLVMVLLIIVHGALSFWALS